MASKKASTRKAEPAATKKKSEGQTERVAVWLNPDQVEWLKGKKNLSATVRGLVTEAMNMEKLALSLKKKQKK